jgi:sodium-dependent dicarboxylate transporter 2/3/5
MDEENGSNRGSLLQFVLLLAGPLLALLTYLITQGNWPHSAAATAAIAVWMAVWWISEAIPLPATALLPIVLLPVFGADVGYARVGQAVEIKQDGEEFTALGKVIGVKRQGATVEWTDSSGKRITQEVAWSKVRPTQKMSAVQTATAPFGDSNIFLYLGGFILAIAVEKWGLHRRFAIGLLMLLGTSSARILLGMMLSTGLLSMWISNTAATTIMLPIALGICRWLDQDAATSESPSQSRQSGGAATMLLLSIAYSATIGGMATTIGTPTNGVALNVLKQQGIEITFLQWLTIAGPIALILLFATWGILLLFFRRRLNSKSENASELLRVEWKSLGRMQREEWMVLAVFLFTAMAWIFRGPLESIATGTWKAVIGRVDDTVIAIFGALLLFILPVRLRERKFLLDWSSLASVPWGVLLIFGGGLSLASAMQSSGLVLEMEAALQILRGWPIAWMLIVVILAVVFLSEMASNVAIATAFTPVVFAMAVAMEGSPQQLVIAATLAASCGFMLPVATPPNAIVFGTGRISQQQMLRVGLILNLVASAIVAVGVRVLVTG